MSERSSGWSRKLDEPIALADGGKLATLRDAADYITGLPKRESDLPEWQTAIDTKDMLSRDFAKVRELAFGEEEDRKISDMRRSGAVEGDAGGGTLSDQANKMANTVATNNRLRKVYNPANVASARRFDQARAAGAKVLEQKPAKSISGGQNEILFQKREPAKPLIKWRERRDSNPRPPP